jgi:hypothetical protein
VFPEGQQRNIDPVSRIPDLIIDATASTPSGIDDYVKIINRGIEIISGSEAFRRYDWLKNVPEVNSASNLRGMVINSNARTVWRFSTNIGKKFAKYEDALVLLNLLFEIAKDSHKAVDVLDSSDRWETKTAKLSAMTSAGIFRALTGVVPVGSHLLELSLEGYLQMADVASGGKFPNIQNWISALRGFDTTISTTYNQIYSGENVYNAINNYLIIPLPPIPPASWLGRLL